MKRCKSKGLCCGAGGAQMFKEAEPGTKEINIDVQKMPWKQRPKLLQLDVRFCNTMMTDGIKNVEKEDAIKVLDVAELIANAADL
jgi:Fe-S oxidoreductase